MLPTDASHIQATRETNQRNDAVRTMNDLVPDRPRDIPSFFNQFLVVEGLMVSDSVLCHMPPEEPSGPDTNEGIAAIHRPHSERSRS